MKKLNSLAHSFYIVGTLPNMTIFCVYKSYHCRQIKPLVSFLSAFLSPSLHSLEWNTPWTSGKCWETLAWTRFLIAARQTCRTYLACTVKHHRHGCPSDIQPPGSNYGRRQCAPPNSSTKKQWYWCCFKWRLMKVGRLLRVILGVYKWLLNSKNLGEEFI